MTPAGRTITRLTPYLSLAPVLAEFSRGNTVTRQIWVRIVFLRSCGSLFTTSLQFVRYIQWFITFPLLLLLVLFATGLSLSDILTTCFFAWVVVVCGLCGALTSTSYKWGFFVLGVAALMYIWCVPTGFAPAHP